MSSLSVMKGVKYSEKRLRQWLKQDGAVVVQTKRDEFRCRVHINWEASNGIPRVSYTSASGKPIYNLDVFDDLWLEVSRVTGQNVFDTGCMVQDSFDLTHRTLRASKKNYELTGQTVHRIEDKPKKSKLPDGTEVQTPGFLYEGPLKARFWFYDLPEHLELYSERRAIMGSYHRNFPNHTGVPETEVVMVDQLYNEFAIDRAVTEVGELFKLALINKHEGLMIKRFEYTYTVGRSNDWMKMKPEDEVDVEIIDYVAGEGEFKGMVGSLVGRAADGSIVSFSGFTLDLRRELSDNFESYRGHWAEVRFMQRDSQGGYRHPFFYRWHPDKG